MPARPAALLLILLACSAAAELPSNTPPLAQSRQLLVGIASDWTSTRGSLQCFERSLDGWTPAGSSIRVLFGRNGLAWGRGLFGSQENGPKKIEKDRCAPAGIFLLGTIFTTDPALPPGCNYPFHTVTERDAWVDDPALPEYNRHVRLQPGTTPPGWFEKQRMRLGDPAYRWLIEVRHNSDPPLPGAGSAIFIHLQRGPDRPSFGCTVMAEPDLVRLLRWLQAPANPAYCLLPATEYRRLWKSLDLPDPALIYAP
jgi:L,D-peptidoglycan transpeptidase YkuD (ErfK/YbiS/YcfS/YnhG family)